MRREFNPDQPRDNNGRWTASVVSEVDGDGLPHVVSVHDNPHDAERARSAREQRNIEDYGEEEEGVPTTPVSVHQVDVDAAHNGKVNVVASADENSIEATIHGAYVNSADAKAAAEGLSRAAWEASGPERNWEDLSDNEMRTAVDAWNTSHPDRPIDADSYLDYEGTLTGTYGDFSRWVDLEYLSGSREAYPGLKKANEYFENEQPWNVYRVTSKKVQTGSAAKALRDFNPDQPRDDHGRWTAGEAAAAAEAAAKDVDKIISKARLQRAWEVVNPEAQRQSFDGLSSLLEEWGGGSVNEEILAEFKPGAEGYDDMSEEERAKYRADLEEEINQDHEAKRDALEKGLSQTKAALEKYAAKAQAFNDRVQKALNDVNTRLSSTGMSSKAFNPDQPRDSHGMWTSGADAPHPDYIDGHEGEALHTHLDEVERAFSTGAAMPHLLKPAEFARRLAAGESAEAIFFDAGGGGGYRAKLAGPAAAAIDANEEARTVDFCISTSAVDRYCDTVALGGWKTANWQKNPVVLWAHDDTMPAIGRGSALRVEGRGLRSTVTFAAPDVYPFADTVFKLIYAGIIGAASVGFIPLKFEPSRDKNRPMGLDIIEQELLEWSVVNIPANADCLSQAKSLGIDMRPMAQWAERVLDTRAAGRLLIDRREIDAMRRGLRSAGMAPSPRGRRIAVIERDAGASWKCGAARDLPVANDDSWDGPAAEKSIFEACGFDGDKPDTAKARKAFLAYDMSAPAERGSYKLPFAKMTDGKLTASAAGIRAAASRLPQADIPQSVKDSARAALDHYEAKMKEDKGVRLKPASTDEEAAALIGKRVSLDPAHALNAPGGNFVRHLADFAGAVGVVSASSFAKNGHRRGRHLVTVAFGDKVMQNLAPDRFVSAGSAAGSRPLTKGLGHVAWLAQLLTDLGCLHDCVEWEAVSEADGSDVPEKLHAALQALGGVLLDMTQEEVSELLDGDGYGDGAAVMLPMALSLPSVQRTLAAAVKSGRVLSAANEKCLRTAHGLIQEACGHIHSVIDQNDDPDDDPQDDDAEKAAAARLRKAQAMKRRAALQAAE